MTMAATNTVGAEILSIQREYFANREGLCRSHQRGIRQIHRRIGILLHKRERAIQCGAIEEPNSQTFIGHKAHQTMRAGRVRFEQVECFGENRQGGKERLFDFP